MPESPLRSSALSRISELRSERCSLESASAGERSRSRLLRLGEASLLLRRKAALLRPESLLLTASPKQLRFAEEFLGGNRYICAAVGANRSGKTCLTTHICLPMWLRDHAPPDAKVWCLSPVYEKSLTLQEEISRALPREWYAPREWTAGIGFGDRHVLPLDIAGRRAVLMFKSADGHAESFESDALDLVLVDESIPEGVWRKLHARLVDKRGRILVSAIPNQPWMTDQLQDGSAGDVWYQEFETNDNANIGELERERFRQSLESDPDELMMRFYGKPKLLMGLVYKEFVKEYEPEGHLCRPFAVPDWWPKWRAMDWGNTAPTVCLWFAMGPTGTMYVIREHYRRGLPLVEHAKIIKEMSRGETYQCPIILDCAAFAVNQSNMTSVGMQFAAEGLPCVPSIRTSHAGKDATVQRVRAALAARSASGAPMLQVFDSCRALVGEFRRHRYRTDRDGRPSTADTYENRDDHALDALRYWVCSDPIFHRRCGTVVATAEW